MTQIVPGRDIATLINVFTVAPEEQQQLVDQLRAIIERTMTAQPGFISASVHKSLDGTRVVNYVQWRRREDFEAMLRDPDVFARVQEGDKLALAVEPHLYEVSFIGAAAPR